ncbi:uncharacterized protein LOC142976258 [Anticarsia gemmatalis]|uniref:uncharacterized protein LOC142976258 n=1 Tax=Anticarsia gemmatalis TaxID=129554 RepID=UPI003F7638DE
MLLIFALILLFHQIVCIENTALYQEVSEYHNETSRKAEFAFDVVRIMYNSFRQWFFTITFCEFTYFENRILKYTENYGNGYNVMLLNGCPFLTNRSVVKPKYNTHGETAYLVTADDLSTENSETSIDALTSTGVFKPRSAVIFVVNTPVELDKYFYYVLKTHFQLLWSRSITNSVLILKSDRLRMYMYNPFVQQVRDITGVKDVSRLLARQYYNLNGYKLRLSVFRKVFITEKTGPVLCDSNLAKTVISFLNATCLPLPPRDDSTVGDLLENGTATGVTADLMEGYTDLELSSRILKNSYYGYIDTTYPLFQDELCFLVKKSDTQSTFNTTIQLISVDMLLLFMFTFIIFIIITITVRKIETKVFDIEDKQTTGATMINLIKCFIRQTVDFTFIGPIFRCLVLLIIVYSLIVDCAIDGIITTAITYPRYKTDLNTLAELGRSNLTLAIHNRDFNIVNKSLSPEFYEQTKDRIELFNDKKIKQAIDEKRFEYAILLKKTDAQFITRRPNNMDNGKPLFYVVPDCPLPCSIVYGLRYGSPYLPRLNYILRQLYQGGILQYWTRTEENSNRRSLLSVKSNERKALSIMNLQEMFYVLLIGEVISTLVFALELLLYKLNKNKSFEVVATSTD